MYAPTWLACPRRILDLQWTKTVLKLSSLKTILGNTKRCAQQLWGKVDRGWKSNLSAPDIQQREHVRGPSDQSPPRVNVIGKQLNSHLLPPGTTRCLLWERFYLFALLALSYNLNAWWSHASFKKFATFWKIVQCFHFGVAGASSQRMIHHEAQEPERKLTEDTNKSDTEVTPAENDAFSVQVLGKKTNNPSKHPDHSQWMKPVLQRMPTPQWRFIQSVSVVKEKQSRRL